MSFKDLVQYIIVRKDLLTDKKWNIGSIITQACHASTAVLHLFYNDENVIKYFSNLDSMHKIENQNALQDLTEQLTKNNIDYKLWIEQPENIPTALAIKPYYKEELLPYLNKLKLFSLVFIFTKHISPICTWIYSSNMSPKNNFDPCIMDWREKEIILFLGICITFKMRNVKSFVDAFKVITRFTKFATLALLVRSGLSALPLAFIYAFCCILQLLYLPQPPVSTNSPGASNTLTFKRISPLDFVKALNENQKHTELNPIYTFAYLFVPSSPNHIHILRPLIDQILEYINKNFASQHVNCSSSTKQHFVEDYVQFYAIDTMTNFDALAKECFEISLDTKISEKQTPTLILYENGIEKIRRPVLDVGHNVERPLELNYDALMKTFKIKEILVKINKHLPKSDNVRTKSD